MDGHTDRNPDGTFAAGNNANPTGNNGRLRGWQRYGDRAVGWLEKLTLEQLQALVEGPGVKTLSSYDTLIFTNLYRAHFGTDIGL